MARNPQAVRVRPMEVADFRFVQNLASKQFQFTRPPRYVLWLLTRTNSRSCMVVEQAKHGRLAYLLSLRVNTSREKALYVWQLAASPKGQRNGGVHLLLLALRKLIRSAGIRFVIFSSVPKSPEFRAIRRQARTLFGAVPHSRSELPPGISPKEHEFIIKVS
jgi:ribosomal protein S18 acetylase RimI-like enzyme